MTSEEADGDADKSGNRGDSIGTVMPGISEEGIAADPASPSCHELVERLF